jgi:small subunit ribosomal protein S5
MTEIKEKDNKKEVVNDKKSVNVPVRAKNTNPSFKKKNFNSKRRRPERAKPEFEQKIIDIRRVTRVVAGGRRFSFSVAIIIGDRKGKVGVGIGKASDTALAIEKSFVNAKKNMIKLKLTKDMSIPHEIEAKLGSARIIIMPAKGRGLVAGSSVRIALDLAGVKDVGAKVLSRSKNKLNIARATIKALKVLDK